MKNKEKLNFSHRDPIGPGIFPLPKNKFETKEIEKMIEMSSIKGLDESTLYIHIPFCTKFCSYCGLLKFSYEKENVDKYVSMLCNELRVYAEKFKDRKIVSIYFGGGTPTLLSYQNFELIFSSLRNFNLESNVEITVEGTPEGFTEEMLLFLKDQGVNRISIGIQSFSEKINNKVSRKYNLDSFQEQIFRAREIIKNINIDLIYNLPDQDLKLFEKTLQYAILLEVEHITINPFVVLTNTLVHQMIQEGKMSVPEESKEIVFFNTALSLLAEGGYTQYSVRDFCKNKTHLEYIKKIAYCHDVIGIGLGAYGYINGVTYRNTTDRKKYAKNVSEHGFTFELSHQLTQEEYMQKLMVMGFRLLDFSIVHAQKLHKKDLCDYFSKELRELIKAEAFVLNNGRIKYSKEGILYANNIRALFANNINYLGFGLTSIGTSGSGNYN